MRNALLIAAAALVALGAGIVYVPAGIIAAGVLLGVFVLLTET